MNNSLIGIDRPVFIIAEIGVNYVLEERDRSKLGLTSDMDVAHAMIDEAVDAGVSAVKFQSFNAQTLQFQGTGKPGYAVTNVGTDDDISYFDMIKKYELAREAQEDLAEYCRTKGVAFFSTPYDRESADFLDDAIDVPLFKLASFELNNHLLIRHVASKGKPLILSTGLSDMEDVRETIEVARRERFADQLVLMQCTSDYPSRPEDVNLNVLKTYALEFPELLLGLSDHCTTITPSLGAVAIGAVALEKHFTLDRTLAGPDHKASLDVDGLREWVRRVREMEAGLGSFQKEILPVEQKNETMKRFLVIEPRLAGTVVDESMLRAMRAGHGVPATDRNLRRIIGRRLAQDVENQSRFEWSMLEGSPEGT